MNRNYSIYFWTQFFGVSLFLGKSLVHHSFFNFRQHFEEIICELFLLADPPIVHHLLLRDVSEGFHNPIFQKGLSFTELVVVVSHVDGKKSVFF